MAIWSPDQEQQDIMLDNMHNKHGTVIDYSRLLHFYLNDLNVVVVVVVNVLRETPEN